MANISLDSTEKSQEAQSVNLGMVVIFLVFLLTVLVYIGILFYSKKLDSDITKTKNKYDDSYRTLVSGNAKNVVSFQNRMDVAKKMLSRGVNSREIFSEIEKLMIPSVYLESYDYDDKTKTVSMKCLADNYNAMAKQILSFKSGTYFSDFKGGESSLDATLNKVSFEVDMKVK